jgi:acetate kinase
MKSRHILTINSGSTSLKFVLFRIANAETRLLSGELDRIGLEGGRLHIQGHSGQTMVDERLELPDHAAALHQLFGWLGREQPHNVLYIVGHRVVHGGAAFYRPQPITAAVIEQLHTLAPDHLPHEIKAIQAIPLEISQCAPGGLS